MFKECSAIMPLLLFGFLINVSSSFCPPVLLDEFQQRMLDLHNLCREKHEGTGNLCWSTKLGEEASSWANKLIDDGGILKASNNGVYQIDEYSTLGAVIQRYGENIYKQNSIVNFDPNTAAVAAVTKWYNEESSYSYSNPGYSDSTRHFTQLIWKATTEVGCGYGVKRGHYSIIVCQYKPTGNGPNPSAFRANVKPRKECQAPNIKYGKVKEIGPYYMDQEITIKCNEGFQLKGSRNMMCTGEIWDVKPPLCTGCPVPLVHKASSVPEMASVVSDRGYVKFQCNPGFTLEGLKVIACMENTFQSPAPRCRPEGECLRPIIANGNAISMADTQLAAGQKWPYHLPSGTNISIICNEGYETVGRDAAVCDGTQFGEVAVCEISEPEAISSSQQTSSSLLLLLLACLISLLLSNT